MSLAHPKIQNNELPVPNSALGLVKTTRPNTFERTPPSCQTESPVSSMPGAVLLLRAKHRFLYIIRQSYVAAR